MRILPMLLFGVWLTSLGHASAKDNTMKLRSLGINGFELKTGGETLLIDPYVSRDHRRVSIPGVVRKHIKQADYIVLTHSHYDHIAAAPELRDKLGIPIAIHETDAAYLKDPELNFSVAFDRPVSFEPDKLLKGGDKWVLNDGELRVFHTPGHTQGGISIIGPGIVFSGDTLFKMGMGRTDLPGGDYDKLKESIRRLLELPEQTVVYPGHGPETTIGDEMDNFQGFDNFI